MLLGLVSAQAADPMTETGPSIKSALVLVSSSAQLHQDEETLSTLNGNKTKRIMCQVVVPIQTSFQLLKALFSSTPPPCPYEHFSVFSLTENKALHEFDIIFEDAIIGALFPTSDENLIMALGAVPLEDIDAQEPFINTVFLINILEGRIVKRFENIFHNIQGAVASKTPEYCLIYDLGRLYAFDPLKAQPFYLWEAPDRSSILRDMGFSEKDSSLVLHFQAVQTVVLMPDDLKTSETS